MAEREFKVKILGDATSAEKAFKRTAEASEKVGPSAKIASQALDDVSATVTRWLGPAAGVADEALKRVGGSAISSGNALSLGVGAGAAVAGGALVAFAADGVSALVDLADQVRDFQRASGASAEDSSRFVAVLDDLGISSEAGSSAIFKLGREIAGGAPKLRQYGIEVERNADGTANFTKTLLNVADAYAYAKAPDQASKTAIAFAAFGKQAQGLLPLLEKGRVGLREFFEGAEQHGQLLSQEDLDDTRELELAIDDLQDAMQGLQFIGAKALVPFLTSITETGAEALGYIERLNKRTGGFLQDIGEGAIKQVAGPFGAAMDLVAGKSDKATESTGELKGAVDGLGVASGETAGEQVLLGEATDTSAEAAKEAAQASKDYTEALRSVLDATTSSLNSTLAYEDAVNGLADSTVTITEKQKAYTDAVRVHGAGSVEAKGAQDQLNDAVRAAARDTLGAAEAKRKMAADSAEAQGKVLSERDAYVVYRDELIRLKDQVAPGSPLRQHLERLVDALPPPEVKFAVVASTTQANAQLEALRQQYLRLVNMPGVQGPSIFGPVGAPPQRRHSGGVIEGVGTINGMGPLEVPLISEQGEFVVRRSAVQKIGVPALEAINRMHEGGPVGAAPRPAPVAVAAPPAPVPHVTYNVYVTAGMGTDGATVGAQVVDAIKEYERRNGKGWRS